MPLGTRVNGGEHLLIGEPGGGFKIQKLTRGLEEVLVIASRSPLIEALLALRELANQQLSGQRGFVIPTLETIGTLLDDLSRGSSQDNST